jgi:hypothetical protein
MDTQKPLTALVLATGIAAIISLTFVATDSASARGWCHRGFPLAGINYRHLRLGPCAHWSGNAASIKYTQNR